MNIRVSCILMCILMVAFCTADGLSQDSPDIVLLDAMGDYYNGEYSKAIKLLEDALENYEDGNRLTAHKFLAFCYIAIGVNLQALVHFKKVLSIDSDFELDSLAVTSAIYTVFREAKRERAQEGACCSCFIPGYGQFMKGEDVKGKVICATSGITLVATLLLWFRTDHEHTEYLSLGPDERDRIEDAYQSYNRWYRISLAGTTLFAAMYLYSIFDAFPFGSSTTKSSSGSGFGFNLHEDSETIKIGFRISL